MCLGTADGAEAAGNEGQADLDRAAEIALNDNTLAEIEEVIRLAESALAKGLNEGNAQFARGLLASRLGRRGAIRAAMAMRAVPTDPKAAELRNSAVADLERAVQLDPKYAQAWLMLARAHHLPGGNRNRGAEALDQAIQTSANEPELRAEALAFRALLTEDNQKKLADLDEASRLAPGNVVILRARALLRADTGKLEEALADLDKVLELDAEHPPTHELKALVLARLKRYDEALAVLEQLRRLEPASIAPLLQKAQIYLLQANAKAALRELDEARKLEPNNVAVLLLRANLLDEPAKKLAELDDAVRIAPQNTTALRARGLLRAELGKLAEALADLDKAIELQPQEIANSEAKALVLAQAKRFDEALATMDAYLKLAPDAIPALRFRAMLLVEAGRGAEARAELEKLHQAHPKDTALAFQLAALYVSQKRHSKAIVIFTAILKEKPDHWPALRGRGDALLNIGRQAEAIADYEQALKLQPKDSGLLNNFAWVLATSPDDKLRDGKRAVELATQACELTDYKAPHILSTLGAAYAEIGDFATALKWVEKGLELANEEEKKSLTKEMESYKSGKPFRELLNEEAADEQKPQP
jgi:tetratricopeptide (TPR) repeat protein